MCIYACGFKGNGTALRQEWSSDMRNSKMILLPIMFALEVAVVVLFAIMICCGTILIGGDGGISCICLWWW